jgi:hypothetical protein
MVVTRVCYTIWDYRNTDYQTEEQILKQMPVSIPERESDLNSFSETMLMFGSRFQAS